MKLRVFSVFDSAAEAFLPPMFLQSRGVAMRSFGDAVNRKDHQFHEHPEHFTLFEIGLWDDSNAQFELHKTPVSCGLAIEFKEAF